MLNRVAVALLLLLLAAPVAAEDWPSRIRDAARESASAPASWTPALGAVAAWPFDDDIRAFSQREYPLFGSAANADARSDDLRAALVLTAIAATLASPSGGEHWRDGRGRRLLATAGAYAVATGTSSALKSFGWRERPNGSDNRSFPSGHATTAFVSASIADAELERFGWSEGADTTADLLLYGTATATAWARIEADRHYASDTLVGAAIGNFVARFVRRLLLREAQPDLATGAPPRADIELHLAWSW